MASLLQCVSDSPADVFSAKKRTFQLNISTKKDVMRGKKYKHFHFETRFLKSEVHFLSSQKQKYNATKIISKFLYHKKLVRLKIEKKPQEPHLKLKKHILNIHREYLLCPQSKASSRFLQTCIDFVEQPLKFSHFEGSIIHSASKARQHIST